MPDRTKKWQGLGHLEVGPTSLRPRPYHKNTPVDPPTPEPEQERLHT